MPDAVPPAALRQRLRRLGHWVRWGWRLLLALIAVGLLGALGLCVWVYRQSSQDLQDIPALTDPARAPLPQPISFVSADGELLGRISAQQRIVLSAREMPASIRQATVAIEDQRFYEHRGVDLQALMRAAWVDLRARSIRQGASTLTMQYVRNVYLDLQKTSSRKLKEVALALQLESQWTKARILTAYLNTVYYGDGAYGVEAASRNFFGHPARELTLAQSALLAAVVQDPSSLDPREHPQAARTRQLLVLDEMYRQDFLTLPQLLRAKAELWRIQERPRRRRPAEPQLMAMMRDELQRTLPPLQRARGGLTVVGSFRMQDIRRARRTLDAVYADRPAGARPVIAASFVDVHSGRILLAAANRRKGYFNFAVQAHRQPGSVVKAFTLAKLIQRGGQLSDTVDNGPVPVRNGSRSYTVQPTRGVRTVGEAIRFSQNPAFWRLYQKAGPRRVLQLQRQLGLRGMDANPAAALGGVRYGTNSLEMAGAFATFARDGRFVRPHTIVQVRDLLGNTVWHDRPRGPQVIQPEYDRQLLLGLRNTVSNGFPQLRANLPLSRTRQIAGKTGTTEDHADAWFAGTTPQLAGAVWTGYARSRRPLTGPDGAAVFGMTIPARTWNGLAAPLLRNQPARDFPRPRGLVQLPRVTGRSLAQAQALLARYHLGAVTYVGKVAPLLTPGKVLRVSLPAGTWLKPSTPITVTYVLAQRTMPQLVGRDYLGAVRELGSFAPIEAELVVSDRPTGEVLGQAPLPGQLLQARQTVQLQVATRRAPPVTRIKKVLYTPPDSELAGLRGQVSSLQRQLAAAQRAQQQAEQQAQNTDTRPLVPDVLGLNQELALQVLQSLGYLTRVQGSGVAVTGQRPSGGVRLSQGATVTLTLG